MIFFTADLHLGQEKFLDFTKRPFDDVHQMSDYIIDSINLTTKEEDTLYILGDFCGRTVDPEPYIKRINCNNINLIYGNHDLDNRTLCEKHSNIFYKSSEVLNATGQLGLVKEIYLSDGWANEKGIRKKCKQCFRGMSKVTFVLIDAKNLETVKKMKKEIRALFKVGNHSVHINDYHVDTIRIAKTVFNDNSIHFLNNRKDVLFPNYKKLMSDTKSDDNTIMTGSTVLSLYGLRDCKDIDLIYFNNPPVDSHNQYVGTLYKLTIDEIFNNPMYHLYYNGFKYVSLDVIKNMKKIRNEPKDVIDVKLAEQIK